MPELQNDPCIYHEITLREKLENIQWYAIHWSPTIIAIILLIIVIVGFVVIGEYTAQSVSAPCP